VSADQPLTGDELATIKARAEDMNPASAATTLRLVAEVERLRAQVERVEAMRRLGRRNTGEARTAALDGP
jgi:hypothetical protein